MSLRKGIVLIVDDDDGRSTQRLLEDSIQSIVRHPNDVTPGDLKRAKLILVDFKLAHWPERDHQHTPSLKPEDGIALIAVLRSNLAALKAAPTAFALNSGMLKKLSGGGDWEGREHAIARSIDLDWVFAKGGKRGDFSVAVSSLANAVAQLPVSWPVSSKTKERILSLLAVPVKARWRQSAIEAIDRSNPPHDILIENSFGVAVLRWLLHAILPFPTFLLSERYLAARLRIEPNSLSRLLRGTEGKKIRKALSAFEYRGILCAFSATRWWRAGIEYWIWDATNGKAFDRDAIVTLVHSKISRNVKFTSLPNPVVSLDDELRPCDGLIDLGEAVEVKPDGWPSFADGAWISVKLANDPAFVALVPQSERNKL
jgi:hypothetical protein